MTEDKIAPVIDQQAALLETFLRAQSNALNEISAQLVQAFHRGSRLFLVGSGPFASIASLVGQTFLHRQTIERPALPAIALTNDVGLATFLAAEEQNSQTFSRQLRALANPDDILVIFSGAFFDSANQEALATAKQLGCQTILIASENIELTEALPDISIAIPTDSEPRLQEVSLMIGNLLCSLVESQLFGI